MRKIGKVIAILSLILASLLGFIGLMALPSGGLMFALPYIFLMLAGIFAFIGIVLLVLIRKKKTTSEAGQKGIHPPDSVIRPM
jgi:LPXTG-motif cell wall-anchored protein